MSAKLLHRTSNGKSKSTPKPRTSKSAKAGLYFPVSRISNKLKVGDFAERVSIKSPVFLAAVLEYIAAEVLELAGDAARAHQKNRITPTHIQLALRNDSEFDKLMAGGSISCAGVGTRIPKTPVKKEEENENKLL